MKKVLLFSGALACVANVQAVPAKGYTKTASGIEYKIVKDVPGTKKAAVGDQLEMHINIHTLMSNGKDTTIFSSRQMNENKPVPLPLEAPRYHGDPSEVWAMMTPGDSAVILSPVDSLIKSGAQLPPYVKPGMKLEYDVVLVSSKTKEEVKKEMDEKAGAQKGIDEKLLQEYFAKKGIKAEKTASGLYYKINTPGTGEKAKAGQTVSVNYTGVTMDGKPFDSNVDPEFKHVEPFKFTLGQGQVIKGWDEGLSLLNKGAKATLYIPSTMAYGAQSPSPAIPANSVLIFDVELVDVQ